jgi:phage baseplate assembly protein gpV
MYKNIRYLYVKDGVIVEYERARRRAQANALSLAEAPREALKHVKERIAALGADSFFMVHNQYCVFSTPSAVDRKVAAILGKTLGLKGHIILNPCSFGLITVKGIAILRTLPDIHIRYTDVVTGTPLDFTAALVYPVVTIDRWAKSLTRRKRPVLIDIREETVLRELQEISLDKIDTWNQLVEIMAAGEDPSFEGPSLDEAGPLLRHGGRHYL